MKTHRLQLGAAALGLALLFTGTLAAQTSSEVEALKRQLAELTQRLSELETNQARTETLITAAEPKLKTLPDIRLGNKGLELKSADGDYSLRLDGGLQLDSRWYVGDGGGTDTFDTRRARPSLRGKLFESWDWRVQYDFASTSLFDAYLRYTHSPAFRIKVGRQKTSVGLERLQGWANTPLPERGLATDLTPTRDNGIQLSGKVLDSKVLYEVGLFNGAENDGRPDTDAGNNKTVSGRLFFTPWAKDKDSALNGLGFGIAGSYGNESDAPSPRYRTVDLTTFFRYNPGVTAEGTHSRINPNFYYYNGAFGLLGEAIFDTQSFKRGGVEQEVDTVAWSITPSYVLTGGTNGFGGVKLDKGAALSEGGTGAWLIAARYTGLKISSDVFSGAGATQLANPVNSARQADSLGLSLSWYPDPNLRVIFAYDYTSFSKGGNLEDEQAFVTRLQYVF